MALTGTAAVTQELSWEFAMKGFIYKKKGRRGIKGWDWRYFVINDMQILWWKTEAEAKADMEVSGRNCKGCIDLTNHACKVEAVPSSSSQFSVGPESGQWTGADADRFQAERNFVFDAARSEQPREVWMKAIKANIDHARKAKEAGDKKK